MNQEAEALTNDAAADYRRAMAIELETQQLRLENEKLRRRHMIESHTLLHKAMHPPTLVPLIPPDLDRATAPILARMDRIERRLGPDLEIKAPTKGLPQVYFDLDAYRRVTPDQDAAAIMKQACDWISEHVSK